MYQSLVAAMVSAFIFSPAQASTIENYVYSQPEGMKTLSHCRTHLGSSEEWRPVKAFSGRVAQVNHLAAMELEDGTPLNLNESLWKPIQNGSGDYEVSTCLTSRGFRDHINFEVYVPERPEVALVVSLEKRELRLFEEATFFENGEVEDLLQVSAAKALRRSNTPSVSVLSGALDYVVCTSSSSLNVRDESLSRVLFSARRFESVKKVQSFGTNQKKKTIGGKVYTFIKTEFTERKQNQRFGWVADGFVKLRSDCAGAERGSDEVVETKGWVFPLLARPTHSYRTGARAYGAGRSGGRLHAACDLYRTKNEKVASVNSGQIIRDLYYFYQGTYAIEVKHSDGRVVRYGEITGQRAPGIGLNRKVATSQTLGYIGKVNSGCCNPMLHFELYTGQGSGPLTQSGNKFQRRWDLIDPTTSLRGWEKAKFGASY